LNVFPDVDPWSDEPDPAKNRPHQHFQALHAAFLKVSLGRALAGGVANTRRINIIVGTAASGKGTLISAVRGAVDGFAEEFSANNLRINNKGGEESRELTWLVPLVNKRVLFASEAKMGGAYDGNLIKGVWSGGDANNMRALYGHAFNAVMQGTPFMMMNAVPNIEPFDTGMRNRVRTQEFDCTFMDAPDPELNQRQKDDTLKPKFKHDADYQDAVLHLILDAYAAFVAGGRVMVEPPGMEEATQENVADGVDFKTRFLRYFDILNEVDSTMYVKGAEIIDVMAKAYPKMHRMKAGDVKRNMRTDFGIKETGNCGPRDRRCRGYLKVSRNLEELPLKM
jgi:phage/plasmid-associated DNA primase